MEKIFLTVWNMGFVSGYVILVVLFVRMVLRRFPKRYSYLLWGIVFFRLVCPVGLESRISLIPGFLFQKVEQEVDKDTTEESGNRQETSGGNQTGSTRDTAGESGNRQETSGENQTESTKDTTEESGNWQGTSGEGQAGSTKDTTGISGKPIGKPAGMNEGRTGLSHFFVFEDWPGRFVSAACTIWLLGVAVVWSAGAYSTYRLKKMLFGAVKIEEGVYEGKGLSASFVAGLLHPAIYLAPGLTENARKYILCHERIHLRRKDYLVKAAALLAAGIHWYHPLVWLAYRQMVRDMEMSCDERVVEELGEEIKKEYSRTLLQMAVGEKQAGLSAAFGGNEVKGRVKNILSYQKPKKWLAVSGLVIVAVVCITLGFNPGGESKIVSGNEDGNMPENQNKTDILYGQDDHSQDGKDIENPDYEDDRDNQDAPDNTVGSGDESHSENPDVPDDTPGGAGIVGKAQNTRQLAKNLFYDKWMIWAEEGGLDASQASVWYQTMIGEIDLGLGSIVDLNVYVKEFPDGETACFFAVNKNLDIKDKLEQNKSIRIQGTEDTYTTIYVCVDGHVVYQRDLFGIYLHRFYLLEGDINHDGITEYVWYGDQIRNGSVIHDDGKWSKGILQYKDRMICELELPGDYDEADSAEAGYHINVEWNGEEWEYCAVVASQGVSEEFRAYNMEWDTVDGKKVPVAGELGGYSMLDIVEKGGRQYLLAKQYMAAGKDSPVGLGRACYLLDWDKEGKPYIMDFYVETF